MRTDTNIGNPESRIAIVNWFQHENGGVFEIATEEAFESHTEARGLRKEARASVLNNSAERHYSLTSIYLDIEQAYNIGIQMYDWFRFYCQQSYNVSHPSACSCELLECSQIILAYRVQADVHP